MAKCECQLVSWKNRRACRLSNGSIEITILFGGGHIADFRLAGSPLNALWEAPWETIDPHTFFLAEHGAVYGEGIAGKFLSGYTGHALALGYFGMPSPEEAAQGLPLHGEAASAEWTAVATEQGEDFASLTLEVEPPVYALRFRRKITMHANALTAAIDESVVNRSGAEITLQWVQHAAFGEPFYTKADASLFVPVTRARTWPIGYEGHELLPSDVEFEWPDAATVDGQRVDLTTPFAQDGTGFVASLLIPAERNLAYIAVHNRRHGLVAGYSFERSRFPWIALWEENRARSYPPWSGNTRVRGVEFGTSPMPLGLDQAREMRVLYDTPVLATIPPNSQLNAAYEMFLSQVPLSWKSISDVVTSDSSLVIRNEAGEIQIKSSRL